ncbi:MAG: hypothetical protein IT368_17730 [Candidatus Hydrogenedentes bacterium]|nr:hypothetical protein [Candidatus Hydrogenedentota bacterium]
MKRFPLMQHTFLLLGIFAAALAMVPASTVDAETLYLVSPHGGIRKIDSEDPKWHAKALADKQLSVNNITFNITYNDVGVGFNDPALGAQRRARLEDALSYVANVLNIPNARTLDVEVELSEFGGNGFLAQAGTFFSLASGFQNGTAFQRLSTGTKPFSNPEIFVTVDFGYNWNITTDPPAGSQFDLISVLTHEITHGMGILSLAGSNGAGVLGGAPNTYTLWDGLIVRSNGLLRLWSGTPPSFKGLVGDLTSNALFFDGTQSFTLYNQGVRAGIFAPNPFTPGSSLSHWDTGNIVGGAIMEHAISAGEERRTYAAVEIGALRDIGYTNAADPTGFTVNVSVQGQGTVNKVPNLASYTAGQQVTLQAIPANGWQFQEWTGNVALPAQTPVSFNVNSNANITAVFVQQNQNFTLTTNVQGSGTVTRNPNAASYASGTVVTLTAQPGNGFVFSNWVGNVANTNAATTTVTMNQNQTVTAVFTQSQPTFTLTTNVSGNGSVTRNPNAASYTSGTVVTVTAVPGTGAQFVNWTGDAVANANSATTTITMNANKSITANFQAQTPAQISVNPGGTVDFGSLESGSSAERVFTVSNTGGQQLSGQASVAGGNGAFFVSLGAAYNIAGGASAPVRIAFAPAQPGEFTATATFTGGQNGPVTVTLTGVATKPAGAGCAPGTGSSADPKGDALVVGLVIAALAWTTRRRFAPAAN